MLQSKDENIKKQEKTLEDKSDKQKLGEILLESRKITSDDIERILHKQKKDKLSFGEAAILLNLITPKELEHSLAVQFSFPYLEKNANSISKEVITAFNPFSADVENFRILRSQLMLKWFEKNKKPLSIVSASAREGRSYIAANLAVVFSQLGLKTLLIDGDLRQPRQHKLFHLDEFNGLSMLLSGRQLKSSIRSIPGLQSLYVLPSGPIPPNPQELLSRDYFSLLLERFSSEFDIVLIDTSAASLGADSEIIASKVGGAFMVTRRNKSRMKDVKQVANRLRTDGVTIVGSVLNKR